MKAPTKVKNCFAKQLPATKSVEREVQPERRALLGPAC